VSKPNWDEIAHDTFDKNEDQPIGANATNLAKFGAPSAAIVAALLSTVLGTAWKVDPSKPAVVIAAAVIVAAVMLGLFYAFASDIRTRGAVTVARYEAVARIAASEAEGVALTAASDHRIAALETSVRSLKADLKKAKKARKTANLKTLTRALERTFARDAPTKKR
jgi:hypothetical protein